MNRTKPAFIPTTARHIVLADPPAEYYTWEINDTPYAIAFGGKRRKADFYFRFRTDEQRRNRIDSWLDNMFTRAREAAARKAERSKPHTLKLGDILDTMWGYDQTNVDYYQVTKLIGTRMVEIREVGCMVKSGHGGPQEYVVPALDNFVGEPMKKVVDASDNTVRIASYAHATPWDGRPLGRTGAMWGH